jgi:hypothetical protein
MASVTHFWISCGVMSIGAKRASEEGFGGTGIASFLASGGEVGGRCEESGCVLVSREHRGVTVDVMFSEEECASW